MSGFSATPGLELVDVQTAAASATLDFVSRITSRFDDYLFVISGLVAATDAVELWMRISLDGSTFRATAADYMWTATAGISAGTSSTVGSASDVQIKLMSNVMSNFAARPVAGEVVLPSPLSATIKPIQSNLIHFSSAGDVKRWTGGGAFTATTGAILGVRFMTSSGNLTSGSIRMYGLRK